MKKQDTLITLKVSRNLKDKLEDEAKQKGITLSELIRLRVNNIHTWIVAHPTKLQKNGKGEYPVPTPYDISGGAHWRNKADNCLCVHRDFESGISTVYSQKIRFKEVGKTGKAEMTFDVKNGRFDEK